jgi:hypothetical protein
MAKTMGFLILIVLVGIALLSLFSGANMAENAPEAASKMEQIIPLSQNNQKDEILSLEYPDPWTDPNLTEKDISGMLNLVTIDPNYSHALIEHPDTALIVRSCLEKKGPYVSFQIEKKKRYLRVCLLDDNSLGFQIVDVVGREIKEKTAYIKDGIKSLKELFEYARKMGYPRFTGPL